MESDVEYLALSSMQARYAVKYGFPLTTTATIAAITVNKGPSATKKALNDFSEAWGEINPFYYVLAHIPQTAQLNKRMAHLLINSAITFHTTSLGPACPTISKDAIASALAAYNNNGKYDFFKIGNGQETWDLLVEHQQSLTKHVLAYA
ncbi:hypothetical protein EDB84DRAFT_1562475 [Lactarius hengduanensis]|nr:hypothetical protein EDB84DRAFT_1562475 [Lactarius hengduanensis]